ncbi:hypothetical protein [Treponema parvum]|uniref:hypothetical protein n=1 Tax=Treponema parvum TaxID=138851 RepID=UPI00211EF657|nr:hypothetical protein [Treponema parvum]
MVNCEDVQYPKGKRDGLLQVETNKIKAGNFFWSKYTRFFHRILKTITMVYREYDWHLSNEA